MSHTHLISSLAQCRPVYRETVLSANSLQSPFAELKYLTRNPSLLLLGMRDKVSSIPEQTNEEKLELSVQERRLRWLAHVQSMSDDRVAKQVLHWIPEERRKRGRLHVT